MAVYVLNEWFWHDASGDNDEPRRDAAYKVIVKLATSDDQIVVVCGGVYWQKMWNFCSQCTEGMSRVVVRLFVHSIFYNADRCLIINIDDLEEIEEDLAALFNEDDHYLVRAQVATDGSCIVSTDGKLLAELQRLGRSCVHRDEFIKQYLEKI